MLVYLLYFLILVFSAAAPSPAAAETFVCNARSSAKQVVFVILGEHCSIPTPPLSSKGVVLDVMRGTSRYSLYLTQMTNRSARATLYLDAREPALRGTLLVCHDGDDRIIWTEAIMLEYGASMNTGMTALCPGQVKAREQYLKQRHY